MDCLLLLSLVIILFIPYVCIISNLLPYLILCFILLLFIGVKSLSPNRLFSYIFSQRNRGSTRKKSCFILW